MTIVFDLLHPAHLNFFKNSMKNASDLGHKVVITVLKRGKLPSIVKKELPQYDIHEVGKHTGSTFSIIFQANIFRFFQIFFLLMSIKPDIGFSVGSFILGFNMKLRGKRNYQFDDDPERPVNVFLEKLTSTRLFFPMVFQSKSSKVENFLSLKEWAYLSPKYLHTDLKALDEYCLKPKEYVFIREVSTGSLNYKNQMKNIIASIANQLPSNYTYLLSLEDKSTKNEYPKSWIILNEPVEDIHSLMFYSKMVISTGDSMAREGAMLGVTSVYCGSREMKANSFLIEKKKLHWINPDELVDRIDYLLSNEEEQEIFREKLDNEWEDINLLLIKLISNSK